MVDHQALNPKTPRVAVFPTPLGWLGLIGVKQTLRLVTIGHASKQEVWNHLAKRTGWNPSRSLPIPEDWNPELRIRLQRYCQGECVDFLDVDVSLPERTVFGRRVLEATRRIAYSQTRTYGQIATEVGSPRAARAVGSVLARNPFPILIPCHRVVAANGQLGGFSAPQGVELKRRLLDMENSQHHNAPTSSSQNLGRSVHPFQRKTCAGEP